MDEVAEMVKVKNFLTDIAFYVYMRWNITFINIIQSYEALFSFNINEN